MTVGRAVVAKGSRKREKKDANLCNRPPRNARPASRESLRRPVSPRKIGQSAGRVPARHYPSLQLTVIRPGPKASHSNMIIVQSLRTCAPGRGALASFWRRVPTWNRILPPAALPKGGSTMLTPLKKTIIAIAMAGAPFVVLASAQPASADTECNGNICTCSGKKFCAGLKKDCIKQGGHWSSWDFGASGKCKYPRL